MYFDRNATQNGAKRSGSAGMHRRANAAWVSPQAVNLRRGLAVLGAAPMATSRRNGRGSVARRCAVPRAAPSTGLALCLPPACGGLCRPEVYTFPGITFSWGRQLANEWRRRGWVGARPVAGGRRQEEEGGAGSELAEPPLAWWRSSRGASPFFLLPAMKLLPAHPRRRRHPEGRSAAEEARSALPSSPWMGTMLSSCRKQENHVSLFLGPPV